MSVSENMCTRVKNKLLRCVVDVNKIWTKFFIQLNKDTAVYGRRLWVDRRIFVFTFAAFCEIFIARPGLYLFMNAHPILIQQLRSSVTFYTVSQKVAHRTLRNIFAQG